MAPPGIFVGGAKEDGVRAGAPENFSWTTPSTLAISATNTPFISLLNNASRVPQLEIDVQPATERPNFGPPKISATNLNYAVLSWDCHKAIAYSQTQKYEAYIVCEKGCIGLSRNFEA